MSKPSSNSLPQRTRPLVFVQQVSGSLLATSLLAACATTSPTPPSLRRAEVAGINSVTDDASTYGLYLAGEAALDQGASRDAAFYLGRASARAPEASFIKERAFAAALVSGEVDRAAELASALNAPAGAPGATPDTRDGAVFTLGLLAQASVDLAHDRGRDAYDLLRRAPVGEHSAAVTLLTPWAAAAAGDWKVATAPISAPSRNDRALAAFGALGQALLLERDHRAAEAQAVYQSQADRGGIFALAYGASLERQGHRTEAAALYDKALAKDAADPAFLAAKARAAANAPAPPLPTVRQGAAQALVGPAALLLAAKQGDAGLAYLRLALRLNPDLDEAWVLVGDAMDAAGDPVAARDAYGHVQPASAEYATAQGRLALSLQTSGDKAGALKLAQATVAAHPHEPQALVILADLLRDDERYAEAVQVLDRLIAETGGNTAASWRLYYLRGASLERAGRWDRAQADLRLALKLKPDDPELLNYFGFALADRGERLDQALGLLQKATMLDPQDGAVVDSLGWVHYRLGDYVQSVRELELAVSLDPADPEVNDHLGDAYWRTGRRLEAQYQWRRVLSLDPDAARRAGARTKLAVGLAPSTTAQAPVPR